MRRGGDNDQVNEEKRSERGDEERHAHAEDQHSAKNRRWDRPGNGKSEKRLPRKAEMEKETRLIQRRLFLFCCLENKNKKQANNRLQQQ